MIEKNDIISNILILSLLQIPKLGRRKGFKLLSRVESSVTTSEELYHLLHELSPNFSYSLNEIDSVVCKSEILLEKSTEQGIELVSYFDEKYPELLRLTSDPPLLLWYKGNPDGLLKKDSIAIIGTRNSTEYGKKYGRLLSRLCSQFGFNIVSGLALGCDTVSHIGALDVNGTTTAVLPNGLDWVYPKENKYLFDMILDNDGLLISEYPIGQKPLPNFFIERDRIQSGLSLGTIVIETDLKSGTMKTVGYTLEYGRMLACVNYPLDKRDSVIDSGNRMLINQGKAVPIFEKIEVAEFLTKTSKLYNNERR